MSAQAEWFVYVAANAMGLMVNAFWTAGVLMWRARKLERWFIPYWKAFVVQLKALGVAAVFFVAAQFIGSPASGDAGVDSIVRLLGLIAWFFAHSSAVLTLAKAEGKPLDVKGARRVTWNVVAFLLAISLVIGGVGLALVLLLPKVT
jgi:hypothetical protein